MEITFKEQYLSIGEFNPIHLPDFTVLTGKNGSGKSHFLQALTQKKIIIKGSEGENPVLFDYKNFFLEGEEAFSAVQIAGQKNDAWNFLKDQLKRRIGAVGSSFGASYEKLVRTCQERCVSFLDLKNEDIQDKDLEKKYNSYKTNFEAVFRQDEFQKHEQAQAIYVLTKKIPFNIFDIEKEEFLSLYKPYKFKSNFLPLQLGKIIWDYYVNLDDNTYREYENRTHGKNYKFLSEAEFISQHGQKPWKVIGEILGKVGGLEYQINNPEEPQKLGRNDHFQLKLTHSKKRIEVGFESLSSGEKVLMALVASVYKASSDNHFPRVLLLDEIDASLHPSMIESLFWVIKEVFLKNRTKVILVTHSPTTIALAPEENIFVMNSDGKDRIVKASKQSALDILTEGYATLEKGIFLFDQISKVKISILTEGNNIDYINKAVGLIAPDLKGKFEVIIGIEGSSGKDQLKTIFRFFTKVPHENKVIVAWDPDVDFKLEEVNNTYPFIFGKNTKNTKVMVGIESLFPESVFKPEFYNEQATKDGGHLFALNKKDFKNYIIKNGTEKDFENFKPLFEKIKALL